MSIVSYKDKLELLGVLAGAVLLLMALGALVGTPWSTARSTGIAVLRVVGILFLGGVGALIIQVTYSGNIREKLPGRSAAE
ncbi:MAG: hypothetical protein V5A55_14240 [Halovenus sp.]